MPRASQRKNLVDIFVHELCRHWKWNCKHLLSTRFLSISPWLQVNVACTFPCSHGGEIDKKRALSRQHGFVDGHHGRSRLCSLYALGGMGRSTEGALHLVRGTFYIIFHWDALVNKSEVKMWITALHGYFDGYCCYARALRLWGAGFTWTTLYLTNAWWGDRFPSANFKGVTQHALCVCSQWDYCGTLRLNGAPGNIQGSISRYWLCHAIYIFTDKIFAAYISYYQ